MKTKRTLPLLIFLCSTFCLQAAPIDSTTAKQVALTFIQSRPGCSGVQAKDFRLAFTSAQMSGGHTNGFYAFNVGDHAFILISADDKVWPILAYSTTSPIHPQHLSPAARELLGGYHNDIQECIQNGHTATAAREQWDVLLSGQPLTHTLAATAAAPLLKTQWGQSAKYAGWGALYNKFCPYDSNARTNAVTGCVATAMAQLIAYWKWPANGYGKCAYTDKKYGYMVADYASANYDYANMPVSLSNTSSVTEIDAVAHLMHDCGVGAGMGYGVNGSGAATLEKDGGEYSAEYVLRNYFGFVNGEGAEKKNNLNTWQKKIKDNIDAGIPLVFRGSDSKRGGHCFVCDGYDEHGLFHFNFGWDGSSDGFYLMDSINPIGYAFKIGQSAIFNLIPPTRLNRHHIVLFSNILTSADTISCEQDFTACVKVQNNGNKPFFGEFRMILENSGTKEIVAILDTLSFRQDSLPGETSLRDSMIFRGSLKSLLTANYNFRLQYRDTNETDWAAVSGIGNFTNIKSIRFDGGSTTTSIDSLTGITARGAEVMARVENACSETVILKAIQYKKSSASSFNTIKDTSSGNNIHALLDNLEPATSYDVQSYVMVQSDATYKTYTSEKISFTTENADGIGESMEDSIRIYPNPSSGNIHIKTPSMRNASVSVINLLGQKIMETQLKGTQAELQLENLAKGYYFISIQDARQKILHKIILE